MNFQMQDIQTVKEIEKPKEIENKESEKSESKEPESNKEKKNQEDQKIKVKNKEKNRDLGVVSFFKFAFSVALFGLTVWVSYLSVSFSTVPLKADAPLLDQIFKGFDAELTFKMDDLQKFIDNTLYISYGFMAVYLVYAISFMLRKFSVPNLIILLVIPTTFGISLVPFTHSLSHNLVNDIPEVFRNAYELSSDFHLSSSYGLFRRMTTTRPEITIQGSDDGKTWLNYEFPYKAGNVTRAPPFVAPHQPRLDWQMWFAALSEFRYNPWFFSLCGKLLLGSKDVTYLLETNPFPEHPPKYIKTIIQDYLFTPTNYTDKADKSNQSFNKAQAWYRKRNLGPPEKKVREYSPVISLEGHWIKPLESIGIFSPHFDRSEAISCKTSLLCPEDRVPVVIGFSTVLFIHMLWVVFKATTTRRNNKSIRPI